MDKGTNKIKFMKFIKKVKEDFSPCEIILFGSRAKNSEWKQSDYDMIIITDKFTGMHWLTRISRIVGYWELPVDIDVIPYTTDEFKMKKKTSSFIRTVIKEGTIL